MKISVLLLPILLAGCAGAPPPVPAPEAQALPVIAIKNSNETTFLEYPASIQGIIDLEIRPQVSGILETVYVNEGAMVKKSQSLFKINALPYTEALNNAKATLQAAKASAINARLEVEKLTPLVKNKVVSEFQLKSAVAALQAAQASVEQTKAAVASAQINVGYTLIKAPVDGYIGRLPKKQGSLVSVTDALPLTQLSDAHEVHVYFSLGEDDFVEFNAKYAGATIADKLKNLPGVALVLADESIYPQTGKVDMVDGQFDKQTGSITLRATFPNQQGLLRSGNTGKIRLSLKHENAILVPQSSTVEIQDKMFVFTVNESNKVARIPITITGTSGTNYLVKEGVKSGDRIVFDGLDKLKDGDLIKPEVSKSENLKTASR